MELAERIFKNKSFDANKLLSFGFTKTDESFCYSCLIADDQFVLTVLVKNNWVDIDVTDAFSRDKYTPIFVKNSEGSFLGDMRKEIETILSNIASDCCFEEKFISRQAKMVADYAYTKYQTTPEFLWDDENSVLRRDDTKKWYAAILHAKKSLFGIEEKGLIEVIDFRIDPYELDKIVDDIKYFRAYHMNKKRWCTIVLNDSVSDDEIKKRLAYSYEVATK